MLQVQEAVDGVAAQEREEDPRQVPEGHLRVTQAWNRLPAYLPPWLPTPPTHTWSGRLGQGNFQVALGTLDLARK